MNITKKEYGVYIEPLVDKCITVSKSLSEPEFAIIGDTLLQIAQNEFNSDNLLNILHSITPLKNEILKKYELTELTTKAKEFLSIKKSS